MIERNIQGVVFAAILLAGSLPASAADTADWVTFSAGNAFTFKVPPGTVPYNDGGIAPDSLIGQLAHPEFKLMFDYGLYSNDLGDMRADPRYSIENEVIDGRKAVLVTGPGENNWGCRDELIAMFMVVSHNWWNGRTIRLEMNGCARDTQTISVLRQVFKTVRFK